MRIFCAAKDSHIFSTENNSGFDNLVGIIILNELTSNDVVRLTML